MKKILIKVSNFFGKRPSSTEEIKYVSRARDNATLWSIAPLNGPNSYISLF